MKTQASCLVFALLSAFAAAAQAQPRPDWEQALALAPMLTDAPGLAAVDLAPVTAPDPAPQELPHAALELPDAAPPSQDLSDPVLQQRDELAQAGDAASWKAVDAEQLDDMRGGFTVGDGLIVSLGLERLVSINGELVARTSFELPAISGSAGDAAEAARKALNSGGLIQNGPGNIAPIVLSPDALGATVIQNTLNDQAIRSQTIINATVNSATLMQSLNFNDSVGQAIRDAVRPN